MKNIINRLLFTFILIFTLLVNSQTPGPGVTIDGQTYPTVIINGREWMAENLKSTNWENGTPSTTFAQMGVNSGPNTVLNSPVTANIQNPPYATPGYVIPNGGIDNSNGLLYNYSIVYNNESPTPKVIKAGWRVPTIQEWTQMIASTGQFKIIQFLI